MKKFLISTLILAMSFCLFACGNQASNETSKEKEYVEESDIDAALNDPDSYQGKYIVVTGKVFNVDRDGDTFYIQAYHDVKNYQQDFIAYISKDEISSLSNNDFVSVDGVIDGSFEGENIFGTTTKCLQVHADSIEVGTYDELIGAANEVVKVGETQEQHDFSVTVDRIEFADDEARVYLSAKNDSKNSVTLYMFNVKAIQDGKQFEHQDNYEAGDQDIGELLAGASKDGVARFTGIDPEKPFTLNLESYSENYDIEMKDFSFELNK